MMDRRIFLTTVAGLLAAPLTAKAQQAGKVYRIGLLAHRATPYILIPFVSTMREHGWVEGRDFTLEPRYTGPNPERARALANELIELKVDLILVVNTSNAQAARQASGTVPIVMLAAASRSRRGSPRAWRGRAEMSPASAPMRAGNCSPSTWTCSNRWSRPSGASRSCGITFRPGS